VTYKEGRYRAEKDKEKLKKKKPEERRVSIAGGLVRSGGALTPVAGGYPGTGSLLAPPPGSPCPAG